MQLNPSMELRNAAWSTEARAAVGVETVVLDVERSSSESCARAVPNSESLLLVVVEGGTITSSMESHGCEDSVL